MKKDKRTLALLLGLVLLLSACSRPSLKDLAFEALEDSNKKNKNKPGALGYEELGQALAQEEISIGELRMGEDPYGQSLQILIENSSERTIRSLELALLGYGEDGQALLVGAGGEFIRTLSFENINIPPEESSLQEYRLEGDTGLSQARLIIVRAGFDQGQDYINPYYEKWTDILQGQDLKK